MPRRVTRVLDNLVHSMSPNRQQRWVFEVQHFGQLSDRKSNKPLYIAETLSPILALCTSFYGLKTKTPLRVPR